MTATLGDILAAARASAGELEGWLRREHPQLAADAAAAAGGLGLGLAGYARMAVADFSRLASEDDWATLVSGLRESENPGSICLAAMLQWRLSARGCHEHARRPDEGVAND